MQHHVVFRHMQLPHRHPLLLLPLLLPLLLSLLLMDMPPERLQHSRLQLLLCELVPSLLLLLLLLRRRGCPLPAQLQHVHHPSLLLLPVSLLVLLCQLLVLPSNQKHQHLCLCLLLPHVAFC
jgi:hypothetical protein